MRIIYTHGTIHITIVDLWSAALQWGHVHVWAWSLTAALCRAALCIKMWPLPSPLTTLQISSALLFVFGPLETQTIRFQVVHHTYIIIRMEVLELIQIQDCSPTNASLTVPGNMRHDSNKLLQSTKLLFSFSIPCNEWCCAAPYSAPLHTAWIVVHCKQSEDNNKMLISITFCLNWNIFPLFADCFLCRI